MEQLGAEDRKLLEEMAVDAHRLSHGIHGNQEVSMADEELTLLTMSTLSEEGVMDVKQIACDRLLTSRVERKLRGKRMPDVLNRMHVAMPAKRDTVARPPVIPKGLPASHSVALALSGPLAPSPPNALMPSGRPPSFCSLSFPLSLSSSHPTHSASAS